MGRLDSSKDPFHGQFKRLGKHGPVRRGERARGGRGGARGEEAGAAGAVRAQDGGQERAAPQEQASEQSQPQPHPHPHPQPQPRPQPQPQPQPKPGRTPSLLFIQTSTAAPPPYVPAAPPPYVSNPTELSHAVAARVKTSSAAPAGTRRMRPTRSTCGHRVRRSARGSNGTQGRLTRSAGIYRTRSPKRARRSRSATATCPSSYRWTANWPSE